MGTTNISRIVSHSQFLPETNISSVDSLDIKGLTQQTVSTFLETGDGLSHLNSSFFPPNWRSNVKRIKSLPMRTATKQPVPVQCLIFLHRGMGDLHSRFWLGIVENIAEDLLLGTSYIEQGIRGIIPAKQMIVPIQSRPAAMLT